MNVKDEATFKTVEDPFLGSAPKVGKEHDVPCHHRLDQCLHDYIEAAGITAYLKNSGKLEVAQQIANHESPRTTKLYDRRQDEISLDEIERITI